MKTSFAFSFRITDSSLSDVTETINNWILDNIERRKQEGLEINWDTSVTKNRWEADNSIVEQIVYTHQDTKHNYIQWSTVIEIRSTDHLLFITIFVNTESIIDSYAPANLKTGKPSLLNTLIHKYNCDISGIKLVDDKININENDIDGLVKLIRSPERKIPIVIISRDRENKVLIDVNFLIKIIGGISYVCLLNDYRDSRHLSELIGDDLGCYNGAIRLYWPGEATKNKYFNRYWSWTQLKENQERCIFDLKDDLLENFSLRSGLDLENKRIRALSEQVKREKEIQSIRAKIETDSRAAADELIAIADDDIKKKEYLEKECYSLKQQLQQLQDALKKRAAYVVRLNEIKTVKSATEQAQLYMNEESIIILPTAFESSEKSQFRDPVKIFRTLIGLYTTSILYHQGIPGLDIAASIRNFTGGCEYSEDISDTTKSKYEADYLRFYNGERILLGPHVGSGKGSSNDCFKIYWYIDKENKKYIIGHIGEHLRDDTK